jgi:hypothetical protein
MFKTLSFALALALLVSLSQGAAADTHGVEDIIPAWQMAAKSCLRGDKTDCQIRDSIAEGMRQLFGICPNDPGNPDGTTWRFQCYTADELKYRFHITPENPAVPGMQLHWRTGQSSTIDKSGKTTNQEWLKQPVASMKTQEHHPDVWARKPPSVGVLYDDPER